MKHDYIAFILLCIEIFLIVLSLYVIINDDFPISENECSNYCNNLCGEAAFVEVNERVSCECGCNNNV